MNSSPSVQVWLPVTSGQCSIPHEANFAWEALPRGPRLLPSCVASMEIPGPCLNIKTIFPRHGDSHVKDKTVTRLSYLYHGDPYTDETSLY